MCINKFRFAGKRTELCRRRNGEIRNGSDAEGILYSQAMLVNETEGKDVLTSNSIRYTDHYVKIDGKWYISSRRSTFLISEKRILDS